MAAAARKPARKKGATRKPARRAPARPAALPRVPGWLWAAVGAGVSLLSAVLLFLSFQPPPDQETLAKVEPRQPSSGTQTQTLALKPGDGATSATGPRAEAKAERSTPTTTTAAPKPAGAESKAETRVETRADTKGGRETNAAEEKSRVKDSERAAQAEPPAPPPPPPAPRYEFYKLLPEQEVAPLSAAPGPRRPLPAPIEPAGDTSLALVTPPAPALPERLYALQVGSFPRYAEAETRKAELALLGVQAQIEVGSVNGKDTHRVRVGPLSGEALARTEALLKKNGFPTQRYALTR